VYQGRYKLSYTDIGDANGYPILVQHGLIASIEDYDLFDSLLGLGTRLISIARPGYGESSPYAMHTIGEWGEMVAMLVDHLQLSKFDVLGMSSGAPYSYSIGYHFPGRARYIFIFSGIPALYDDEIVSRWPYEVKKDASISEMEKLAFNLFFSGLSRQDLARRDIRDSMMNDCFGPGLDFRIRGMDWGFILPDVHQNVYMQHSRKDEGFITAELTSKLLPNCDFMVRESEGHFSKELLGEFIEKVMAKHYR
jgi:pimeloyl-ACP methyl ester carboxylesterase